MKPHLLVGLMLAAGPAFGAEPQVGRWAAGPQYCGGSGDTMRTAPLTVTESSLRWMSEYCSIGKMYKADQALYIEGRCSYPDGLMMRHPITLAMKGKHLAVTWNGERVELQRCP